MAFYDWNQNGKKDMQDDYLEYKIYQESTKNNQASGSGSHASGGGCLMFVIVLFIIGILSNLR
ncbi:MAG: hypothetical protein E7397_02955 [Ruminococcaceae bacterium]|nr:hypothetical protein [Oscillospiraceae bacterium]